MCLVFELADAVEELTGEYGAGIVQAKIASQALGFGQTVRAARCKQGRLARSGAWLHQAEFDVAMDESDADSCSARDHGELDGLLIGAGRGARGLDPVSRRLKLGFLAGQIRTRRLASGTDLAPGLKDALGP